MPTALVVERGARGAYGRALSSGVVDVRTFGARGDGVSDDTAAVRAAHEAANAVNAKVSYSGIRRIAIQANAQIPLRTSTDFAGCEIVILGGVNATPSFNTLNTLYLVEDPACPVVTQSNIALTASNLTEGSRSPTFNVFNGPGVMTLQPNVGITVPNRTKDGTQPYVQAFKVSRQGLTNHPVARAMNTSAADMTIAYRVTSKNRIFIDNATVVEGAWNNQRIFSVRRSNVEINGLSVLFNDPDTLSFDNICELISLYMVCDVTINDFVTTGRRFLGSNASYCLAINSGADIFVNRMHAITGWGATGTNDVSGLYFTDCVLNRVDAHSGGFNIFVENCDLHDIGVVYGWGGGVISVANCRAHKCPAIGLRADYGGAFYGDLVIDNVQFEAAAMTDVYACDLASNPMGASIQIPAPRKILISNISRNVVGSGSAPWNFGPLALRAGTASQVVNAPDIISVDGVFGRPPWRFLMGVDFRNFEGSNLHNRVMVVTIANVRGNDPSTNATGLVEYTSIRTPTNPVRARIFVTECDNVRVRVSTATLFTEVHCSDCSINAIDVSTAGTAPVRVTLENCQLLTMATGYTNAPVGGTNATGFTDMYTSMANCFVSSAAWNLSLMTAAQGNLFQSGATALMPAGATVADFFTGWRKSGVFA